MNDKKMVTVHITLLVDRDQCNPKDIENMVEQAIKGDNDCSDVDCLDVYYIAEHELEDNS